MTSTSLHPPAASGQTTASTKKSYAVKEIFKTLQGEGAQAGRVAVFCRFTGCNLWSGREQDRDKGQGGCARWCDTDFVGTDGQGGGKFSNADELADCALALWGTPSADAKPLIVCTGGEPLLQLDQALVQALHARGFEVAIETNGTLPIPAGVDWVCVSPKAGSEIVVKCGQELKFVVPQEGLEPQDFEHLDFAHWYVQPKDGPERAKSLQFALTFCYERPKWRLSLQTHKFIGID